MKRLKDYFKSEIDKEKYFNDPEYRRQILQKVKLREKAKIIISILLAVLFTAYLIYLFLGLPSLQQLENPTPELATKVYSYDGELLGQFYIKQRATYPLTASPKI